MDARYGSRGGFTLIELLVVMAIIAVLAGFGLTMLMGARDDADEMAVKSFIKSVEASLDLYRNDRRIGVYPPTSLEGFPGFEKQPNATNVGIEALVVCLNSKGFKGDRVLASFEDSEGGIRLENLDGDRSPKPMTIYGARDLFEVLDPWGNPFVYFNANDYDRPGLGRYLTTADEGAVEVRPWRSEKTKSYYHQDGFQLFSAGPDGVFNTEDDIGNW